RRPTTNPVWPGDRGREPALDGLVSTDAAARTSARARGSPGDPRATRAADALARRAPGTDRALYDQSRLPPLQPGRRADQARAVRVQREHADGASAVPPIGRELRGVDPLAQRLLARSHDPSGRGRVRC